MGTYPVHINLTTCRIVFMRLVAMTFCYRRVKTRNKSLRSRATEVIRIKSAGIELEDPGIIIFRFRLSVIACTGKSIQFVISHVVGCLPSLIVCRHLPATPTTSICDLFTTRTYRLHKQRKKQCFVQPYPALSFVLTACRPLSWLLDAILLRGLQGVAFLVLPARLLGKSILFTCLA